MGDAIYRSVKRLDGTRTVRHAGRCYSVRIPIRS